VKFGGERQKRWKVQVVVVNSGNLGEVSDRNGKRAIQSETRQQSECKLSMIIRMSGRVGYCRQ
jgi:hypothetical protein